MSSDTVAADAWPLIQKFREAGANSFEKLGVAGARETYERSCAINALPRVEMRRVVDVTTSTPAAVPVRIYTPVSASARPPGILFLHGGGWVIGSLETHDALCRTIAHETSSIVVAVDYRLAPEHPYPAAIDDARAAWAWLLDEPAELGAALSCLAIVGDSAGGALAAVVENEHQDEARQPRLVAQVLLYPVTDLRMATPSYARVTEGFPLTAKTMEWFAGLYAPGALVDPADPSVSPLHARFAAPPVPAFVCTVGMDPLADEGIQYAAMLAHAGGAVEHRHLPRHAHGLFTAAGVIATGRKMLSEAVRFLNDAFGDAVPR